MSPQTDAQKVRDPSSIFSPTTSKTSRSELLDAIHEGAAFGRSLFDAVRTGCLSESRDATPEMLGFLGMRILDAIEDKVVELGNRTARTAEGADHAHA